jgi:hypothetical protein
VPGENFVLLVDVARANFRVNPFLHGSARWADLSDIKAAGLLNNDGVYVGAWRVKGVKSTTCGTPALSTSLCYAPTRSGKGVGLIVGSFDERGSIPLTEYFPIFRVPEYSELLVAICGAIRSSACFLVARSAST